MATVHELADVLAERLRDLNATAFTRADLRTALSTSQRMLSAKFALVQETTSLTTKASRTLYPFVEFASDCVRILEVYQLTNAGATKRRLDPVRYQQFRAWKLDWLTDTDADKTRLEAWAPVGRDLLAIYPALSTTALCEVKYVPLLAAFDAEDNTVQIPDDYHPLCINLALLLCCLKGRMIDTLPAVLTTIQLQVKEIPNVPR